ncbi:MAG TPA: peptide chain release factor N(5)-glutamine methyltransferase [Burkholderiales bacterium]|nr:peptide chain release factor N(5)-glutamine methyltransferase [Burkholderiales bacterium]
MSAVALEKSIRIAQALRHTGLEAGDARPLLQAVLGADRVFLVAHDDEPLSPGQAAAYYTFVKRRRTGEPVAYILGEREFYGLNFKVTPAVLIPRPETELLVELALARIPQNKSCKVLDLGTGCGNVAVALARHRPLAQINAVDYSAATLEVAKQNAQNLLGETNSIRFQQSDWYAALNDEKFDLIVSNPPYVAASDPHLQQGDLRFEPGPALLAGSDGLECIKHIASRAPRHLHGGGCLLFEHGYGQAEACRSLLAASGFFNLFSAADLAGIPRVCGGQIA